MPDNRCVRIADLKRKIKYHPEVGTYVSEEDIDLAERVFCKCTEMRNMTEEEQQTYKKYIDSISTPTGFDVCYPRVYNTGGYVTTTTTNIKVEKCDDDTIHLPTAKEYRETAQKSAFQFTTQWSEPKYQCPECGGGMCKNLMVVLSTYPPKYEYQCGKCGYIDYQCM